MSLLRVPADGSQYIIEFTDLLEWFELIEGSDIRILNQSLINPDIIEGSFRASFVCGTTLYALTGPFDLLMTGLRGKEAKDVIQCQGRVLE